MRSRWALGAEGIVVSVLRMVGLFRVADPIGLFLNAEIGLERMKAVLSSAGLKNE